MAIHLIVYILSFIVAYKAIGSWVLTSADMDSDAWKLLGMTTASSMLIGAFVGGFFGIALKAVSFYVICWKIRRFEAVESTWLASVWTIAIIVLNVALIRWV